MEWRSTDESGGEDEDWESVALIKMRETAAVAFITVDPSNEAKDEVGNLDVFIFGNTV